MPSGKPRQLRPLTYRGLGLVSTGRTAFFHYDSGAFDTPRRDPISVERVGRFPSHVRVQPEGKMFPLEFAIRVGDSQQQFEAITKILNPDLGLNFLRLEDCDNRQYRLNCIPTQAVLEQRSDKPFIVPLWAPDPFLEDDSESLSSAVINGGGNPISLSITNIGTADALSIAEVTPRQQRTQVQAYTRMREISYANRSEFPLTGPGSGTWMLMLIENWDTAAIIAAGDMQSDGRDIAVFVDGVQVPPEKITVADINTIDTKVWIEIADAPAQHATLQTAIVAGTITFDFENAEHGFRVGDYLVWEGDPIYSPDIEQAKVTAVDGDSVTVERGVRNTTAGESPVGTIVYRSGHHIQLAWRWSGATARPTNPDPPLIDTSTSDNLHWDWPEGPIWPDRNRRPGGWRRILYDGRDDIPELRKNRLSAKTTLDIVTDPAEVSVPVNPGDYNRQLNDVRFEDQEPTAGNPNFDALEFRASCGIDDVLGAIEYDAALGWPFAFQIIGRDLLGLDTVIFNRIGHEVAAAHFPPRLYTDQQETPDEILSAVIFRARQMIVTTARPSDAMEETLVGVNTNGHDLQGFHIDEITPITALVARARDFSGNAGLALQISEVASGSVDRGGTAGAQAPGDPIAGPFSGWGGIGSSFLVACAGPGTPAAFTTDIPVLLSGDYFLSMAEVTPGSGEIRVPVSDGSIYAHGSHWEHDGSGFVRVAEEDLWFAILSIAADNQEDALNTQRTGEQLLLRNISLVFDPDRTPLIDSRPEENAYYFDNTWTRGTDEIHLRYLARWALIQDQTISIDIKERTVTDESLSEEIREAIEVNGDPWLRLIPGSNTVSIETVGGAVEEDHQIRYRHVWQA